MQVVPLPHTGCPDFTNMLARNMTCVRSTEGQKEYEKVTNQVIESYRATKPWPRDSVSTRCRVQLPKYNTNDVQECERFSRSKVGAGKDLIQCNDPGYGHN